VSKGKSSRGCDFASHYSDDGAVVASQGCCCVGRLCLCIELKQYVHTVVTANVLHNPVYWNNQFETHCGGCMVVTLNVSLRNLTTSCLVTEGRLNYSRNQIVSRSYILHRNTRMRCCKRSQALEWNNCPNVILFCRLENQSCYRDILSCVSD